LAGALAVKEGRSRDMTTSPNEQFSEDGFAVVRGLLAASDIAFYIDRLKALAGAKERWTQPDGVNRNPDFWPIILNERLIATVRGILGHGVRYLPHNDLHRGFSSFSWHRDSVNRDAGKGPDWDESREPYRLARVGIYLQRFDESGFKIGFVKGSHRHPAQTGDAHRRVRRRTGTLANVFSGLSGVDLVGADAEWVATDPGDCVIFDPRILHTGSRFHGPKYSVFVAYGIENSHFFRHRHYYMKLRTDLDYSTIAPALADRLRADDLLAHERRDPVADRDDARVSAVTGITNISDVSNVSNVSTRGAWIPSSTFTYVARRFK
jgi:hypothetical protein